MYNLCNFFQRGTNATQAHVCMEGFVRQPLVEYTARVFLDTKENTVKVGSLVKCYNRNLGDS